MMKICRPFLLSVWIALVASPAGALEVGDLAPNFNLPGSDGKTYQLADYRGKQAVVLAWFPKAYTYGCTVECKSLAENGHLIKEFEVTYFMVSVDALVDNKGFAAETGADFPLLSDEDRSVAKTYGVLHEQGFAKRRTVYIDKAGRVLKIDADVRPETSAEDMASTLATLGIKRRATGSTKQ